MAFRLLRASLFLLTALVVAAFMVEAVRLVANPLLVEPVEGAVLQGAQRLVRGAALYDDSARPTNPAPMPVYPVVTSLLARTFGLHLWVPRLLALLATLTIGGLILTVVRIETRSWTLALSGLGVLFLGHALLAEQLGVARPETLMLSLVLLAFLELRVGSGLAAALSAALLLSAAVFVDLRAGWFVVAAAVAIAVEDRRRLVVFAAVVALVVGGGYVALSRAFGPWFNFAAWDGPLASMRANPWGLLHYVCDHLLGKLGISTLAVVLSFALPTRPWHGKSGVWMCFGVASFAAVLWATQRLDFGPHDQIPGIIALAMLGPISIQRVTGHLSTWPGSTRLAGRGVVLAAVTLQVIVLLSSLPLVRADGDSSPPTSVSTS